MSFHYSGALFLPKFYPKLPSQSHSAMNFREKEEAKQPFLTAKKRNRRMKAKKETVLSLATMGLPVDKIAEAVKVSVQVVKEWIDAGMNAE